MGRPKDHAAGVPAVTSSLRHAHAQMGVRRSLLTLRVNQKAGVADPDAPGPGPSTATAPSSAGAAPRRWPRKRLRAGSAPASSPSTPWRSRPPAATTGSAGRAASRTPCTVPPAATATGRSPGTRRSPSSPGCVSAPSSPGRGRSVAAAEPSPVALTALAVAVGVAGGNYGIGGGSLLGPILAARGLPMTWVAPAALAATFATSVVGAGVYALLPLISVGDVAPDWWHGARLRTGRAGRRLRRRPPAALPAREGPAPPPRRPGRRPGHPLRRAGPGLRRRIRRGAFEGRTHGQLPAPSDCASGSGAVADSEAGAV